MSAELGWAIGGALLELSLEQMRAGFSQKRREATRLDRISAALDTAADWLQTNGDERPAIGRTTRTSLAPEERQRLEQVLQSETAVEDLADVWVETAPGLIDEAVMANLVHAIAGALDLNASVSHEFQQAERLQFAFDLLVLFGAALDVGLFAPQLRHAEIRARSARRVTELVARELEGLARTPASASEVRSYLIALVEWLLRALPDRQGFDATLDELHRPATLRVSDQTIEFDHAVRRHRRLMIEAAPGSGKSWLAHRHALETARRALADLQRGAPVEAVSIPLLARCAELEESANLWGALVSPSRSSWLDRDRAERLVARADQPLTVVLDGWDEAARTELLMEHLQLLLSSERVSLLLTCRTSHAERPRGVFAPHGQPRIGRSVGRLEHMSESHAANLVRRVSRALGVPHVARVVLAPDSPVRLAGDGLRVPLLAVLAVQACAYSLRRGASVPTTVPQLYDVAIEAMLFREATERASPRMSDLDASRRVPSWVRVLSDVAWSTLAPTEPTRRTTLQEAVSLLSPAITPLDALPQHERSIAMTLLDPLGDREVAFLHRTLQEHLAAKHLAAMPAADRAELARRHLFFWEPWAVLLPSAVAQSTDRDAFLKALIPGDADNRPLEVAGEVRQLLITTAAASHPEEWRQDSVALLRALMASATAAEAARTRQWSPHPAVPALRARLGDMLSSQPTASTSDITEVVAALAAIDQTLVREHSAELVGLLSKCERRYLTSLARVVADLGEDAREASVRAVLARLESRDLYSSTIDLAITAVELDPRRLPDVVDTLVRMLDAGTTWIVTTATALVSVVDPMPEHAVRALLSAMSRARPSDFAGMAALIDESLDEVFEPLVDLVISRLGTPDVVDVPSLLGCIARSSPRRLREAIDVVWQHMEARPLKQFSEISRAIRELDPSYNERLVQAVQGRSAAAVGGDLIRLLELEAELEARGTRDVATRLEQVAAAMPAEYAFRAGRAAARLDVASPAIARQLVDSLHAIDRRAIAGYAELAVRLDPTLHGEVVNELTAAIADSDSWSISEPARLVVTLAPALAKVVSRRLEDALRSATDAWAAADIARALAAIDPSRAHAASLELRRHMTSTDIPSAGDVMDAYIKTGLAHALIGLIGGSERWNARRLLADAGQTFPAAEWEQVVAWMIDPASPVSKQLLS
ncbi:MAG TPA: NACHT domain-containing protein [Acidimicrobiales bacterium]